MKSNRWKLRDYLCRFYQHAGYIFSLAGVIMGSGVYLTQEYLFVQPQWKKLCWILTIVLLGMAGLMTGNMIQRLYGEADTDPLTRLGNRRRFYRRVRDEIELIRETKKSSALALIDVDNFKWINDTQGHNTGDQVLVRISTIFRENIRPNDSIIRWGGDEFVFIFSGCNVEEAQTVLDRIRTRMKNDPLVRGITISAGLMEIKEQMDIDQAVKQADCLLAKAKEIKDVVMI